MRGKDAPGVATVAPLPPTHSCTFDGCGWRAYPSQQERATVSLLPRIPHPQTQSIWPVTRSALVSL